MFPKNFIAQIVTYQSKFSLLRTPHLLLNIQQPKNRTFTKKFYHSIINCGPNNNYDSNNNYNHDNINLSFKKTSIFCKHNKRIFNPSIQYKRSLFIEIQETPNPNSLKFLPQRAILQDGVQPRDYPTPKSTFDCSLASQLHQINGVSGVYIGRDFITISKSDDVSWANIDSEVRSLLMEYFSTNKHINIAISKKVTSTSPSTSSRDVDEENEDEVIEMIKELIESKIRPTVQEDGGDIVYVGFEEGIVKVKLQGSCTTCPSSEVTLKRGVQNMLQFYVPEVLGVVQVEDEKDELSNKEFEKLDSSLDKDSKEN